MVTAELSHNPYLLWTDAQFNGHEPRINSPIEKYEGRPLVEWVEKVPRIFHDEMNGYDFDFKFTGTDSDFEKLCAAFKARGIDQGSVRITRKGGYKDVTTKMRGIAELLEWLNQHRNRRFDYEGFIDANSDALDCSMPYIIIQDDPLHIELPFANVEIVGSAYDLASTDLTHIPILITVDRTNRLIFRKELQHLLDRLDIEQRQLFILIHPDIDKERSVRVITDLGVDNPQVVDEPDDARIIAYINDYPAMDYTRNVIRLLRDALEGAKEVFTKVDRFGKATNVGAKNEINTLERRLDLLKDALAQIRDKDFSPFIEFDGAEELLEGQITTWRNRKSSVSGHDQVVKTALDFAADLQAFVRSFKINIKSLMDSSKSEIEQSLAEIYEASGAHPLQLSDTAFQLREVELVLPDMATMLGSLTETSYISTRNDFFGLFAAIGDSASDKTPIEVANLETWRSLVRETLTPLVHKYEHQCRDVLRDYQAALVQTYSHQLKASIDEFVKAKERASSRLSSTAQRLQEDSDWLDEFEERLSAIEWN